MILDADFKEVDHTLNADFGEVFTVGNNGKVDYSVVANALKGKISGSAVSLSDISPFEHILKVKVRSENILPFPYLFSSQTLNGINIIINDDGTMSMSGIPTKATSLMFANNLVLKKGQYFFKVLQNNEVIPNNVYYAYVQVGETYYYDNGLGVAFTITEPTSVAIRLIIGMGYDGTETTFKPMLSPTATPYTPYVSDLSKVNLCACGKNLMPINTIQTPLSTNPILFEGNITGKFVFTCDIKCNYNYGTASLFEVTINGELRHITPNALLNEYKDGFPLNGTITKIVFRNYCICKEGSIDNIQLEPGTVSTEFETFKGKTYPINADGTVEGVNSIYPTTTLYTDTEGVVVDVEYNRDINKAFAELTNAILSLGGNV